MVFPQGRRLGFSSHIFFGGGIVSLLVNTISPKGCTLKKGGGCWKNPFEKGVLGGHKHKKGARVIRRMGHTIIWGATNRNIIDF